MKKHRSRNRMRGDVTETVTHPLSENEGCPKRGLADCTPTGESDIKYEYDVRVSVVKTKHEFFYYKCDRSSDCRYKNHARPLYREL